MTSGNREIHSRGNKFKHKAKLDPETVAFCVTPVLEWYDEQAFEIIRKESERLEEIRRNSQSGAERL